MKRMVLLFGGVVSIMLAAYAVQSYSSAMIENEASLISSNPDNIIFMDTEDSISLTQGNEFPSALTIENNFANEISYELKTSNSNFSLNPAEGELLRGEATEISLIADDTIQPGDSKLEVILNAEFEGGEVTLQTSFRVEVEEQKIDVNKEIIPDDKESDDCDDDKNACDDEDCDDEDNNKNGDTRDEEDNGEGNNDNNKNNEEGTCEEQNGDLNKEDED